MQLTYRSTVGFSYDIYRGTASPFCGYPALSGTHSLTVMAPIGAARVSKRFLGSTESWVTELESDSLEDLHHGYG